jgi:hypothetical protein
MYFNAPGALMKPSMAVFDTMKQISNPIFTVNMVCDWQNDFAQPHLGHRRGSLLAWAPFYVPQAPQDQDIRSRTQDF